MLYFKHVRKDIGTLLRDADPAAHEGSLPAETAAELRRTVLAAASTIPVHSFVWGRQLAMAACLTVMVLTGLVAAHRVPSAARAVSGPAPAARAEQRTQIHFSTPGGTRIIWTLDPDFQLMERRK